MSKLEFYDTACPECKKEGRDTEENNLRVFSDSQGSFCIAGHGFLGNIGKKVSKKEEDEIAYVPKVKVNKDLVTGEIREIQSRRISKETCEKYSYEINMKTKEHIANWFDDAGNVVMQQIRTKDKKFFFKGDTSNHKLDLWGKHLWNPSEQVFVTITEGQLDCLSVAQCFECRYPILSLPNGAGSAYEVLEHNKKYLEGFKYVVIAFDNDKAGNDAVKECLKIFSPGKLRIAKWRLKDANDLLKIGAEEEIKRTIYEAVAYLPSPIITGKSLKDTLKGYRKDTVPWPWQMANLIISPIQIPAIYTLAALPGVGKTSVMADLIKYFIKIDGKVGVISLEESLQKLVIKICDKVLGTNLSNVENREFTKEEIDSTDTVTEAIVTYDHRQYGTSIEQVLENLPYIAQSMKCRFIIFDNLSFSATGSSDDERRNIDKAMLDLKTSSTKYNYTLFNICHLNDDSKDDFTKATIRGSRGVFMYSDQVIYLGRDTENEDISVRNTLKFYYKKDREFGVDTGKSFSLSYCSINRSFEE